MINNKSCKNCFLLLIYSFLFIAIFEVEASENCDCGEHSTRCDIFNGEKQCSCKFRYAQVDGICKDCDCGLDSFGCSFEHGKKKCYCTTYHMQNNGKCEECNCGDQGACEFIGGKKKCTCLFPQAEFQGKCKNCFCGLHTGECGFSEDGKKICNCLPGYIQKDEECVVTAPPNFST